MSFRSTQFEQHSPVQVGRLIVAVSSRYLGVSSIKKILILVILSHAVARIGAQCLGALEKPHRRLYNGLDHQWNTHV